MRTLIPFLVMLISFGVSYVGHNIADERRNQNDDMNRVYLPSGDALRVASMGYHTALADLMWIRSVLNFVEIFEDHGDTDKRWLRAMLTSVSTLDPPWRTVYFHGGGMLRLVEDIDASDELFLMGMENLPEDPYFPFSVAMNAYLYHKDIDRATEYINHAATLPNAPSWYRVAAAGFMSDEGQRMTAIEYLKEKYAEATEDAVREAILQKLKRLLHEEFSERLGEKREKFQQQFGRDITSVEELAPLPEDPYEQGWIISPDDEIISPFAEDEQAGKALKRERRMLTSVQG